MTSSLRSIQTRSLTFTLFSVFSLFVAYSTAVADSPTTNPPPDKFDITDGTLILDFDPSALAELDFRIVAQGQDELASTDNSFTFSIAPEPTFSWHLDSDGVPIFTSVDLAVCGALLFARPGERVVIANPTLRLDPDGVLSLFTIPDDSGTEQSIFDLTSIWIEAPRRARFMRLVAELSLSPSAAERWIDPDVAGRVLGTVTLLVEGASSARAPALEAVCQLPALPLDADASDSAVASTAVVGPDVLVADLQTVSRFTRIGDITAYGIGTTACNIGTQRASWISYTNQHPVIIQNLYRLKEDRFEQIGMAWVKHGFYAVSQSFCTTCNDPTDGSQLGVGCSDPYSASLNGVQTNMSPRALVNAKTGYFPYPWSGGQPANLVVRRLQVHDADLLPALNPNSRYFIEGHYVTPGDCAAGTDENNSSYREVSVLEGSQNVFNLTLSSGRPTQRGQPAVRAWRDVDPAVVETDVPIPGEGLLILAAKATTTGDGIYRYSYSLQNLNSDRSARSFSVLLPIGADVSGSGFHGAEYHSGEPFNNADWSVSVTSDAITWSTDTFEANPNANALRYATVFTFWLDVNVEPDTSKVTIGLFKPGGPSEVLANTVGPKATLVDCNNNQIADACDIDCGAAGCVPPCGGSIDCNENRVPDECEADCNGNGMADACDIARCPPNDLACADCNANTVPDGCEADCDSDGIPNDCDPPGDCDGDGVDDCTDLCPCTTPAGACSCPSLDRCCFSSGLCIQQFPRNECISLGGTPDCMEVPCRDGCLLGDCDSDGDLDSFDFAIFLAAFGHSISDPEYDPDADLDDDETVTLADYQRWLQLYRGFIGDSSASAPLPGVLGDLNADADVDLGDFANLQSCVNSAAEMSLLCIAKFDFDGDWKVGLGDLTAFLVVFNGPR